MDVSVFCTLCSKYCSNSSNKELIGLHSDNHDLSSIRTVLMTEQDEIWLLAELFVKPS